MADLGQQIESKIFTSRHLNDKRAALMAVLELWQDPEAVAGRPLPEGEVAQAMWHFDFGRAAGINEALLAVAKALGIEAD